MSLPTLVSDPSPTYRTSSLFEAAYLRMCGFRVIGKDQQGTKTFLLFERNSELQEAVTAFYNGSEAQQLFQEYESLKDFAFGRRE